MKVNINLGRGLRVTSDAYQFIIQQHNPNAKTPRHEWKSLYYHAEIEPLLHCVALMRTRQGNATTLKELIECYRKERKALSDAVTRAGVKL